MRMTLNDIGKVLWRALSAVIRAASGITLCAEDLAVDITGEVLPGVLNFIFSILTTMLSVVATIAFFIWLLAL